jgi:uncharacterized protein (DUF2336 family)
MSTLDAFVGEVELAIAGGNPERRARSLRDLTDLFVGQAGALNENHLSVFDEVILRLAQDVEQPVRVELSTRLARVGNAPKKVVRVLARDDHAAVAEPVLERSPQLTEDDLVEVAGQKAQDHLLAISRRSSLSERITDMLVDRGDARVVRAVAENGGAKLSKEGLTKLAARAQSDSELRGVLQKRPDLPAGRLKAVTQPSGPKQAAPQPGTEETAETRRMEAVLARLAKAMVGPAQVSDRDIAPALERLGKTAKGKTIEEVRVANWIKAEKTDEALAAIAHNAGLPAVAVIAAYEASGYEPLLVVVRAARLSWNAFKLLFTARDGKALPGDALKSSFAIFQQVPVTQAQKLGRLLIQQAARPAADAA